jgi:chromosome segregation ATPase
MLASVLNDHAGTISILVPIVVALIASLAAPLWLARRKDKIDASVGLIEEGRELRRDLAERVDKLELRLESAGSALNDALDEIRRLRSECERHLNTIDRLEAENQFLRETS